MHISRKDQVVLGSDSFHRIYNPGTPFQIVTTGLIESPEQFGGRSALVRSDFRTPTAYAAFRSKVSSGRSRTIQYNWGQVSYDGHEPYWVNFNPRGQSGVSQIPSGAYDGTYNFATSDVENVDFFLLNDILKKMKNEHLHFSMALANVRKTSSFLKETVTSLATTIRFLKTGQVTHAVKQLFGNSTRPLTTKVWAERYLEYKYALTPLMIDVENAWDGLTRESRALEFIVKSRAQREINVSFKSSGIAYTHTGKFNAQRSHRFLVDSPLLVTMSEAGLTPTDLLVAAWDVIPWSFVVDWVIPVSDFLNALGADYGLYHLNGYTSRRIILRQEAIPSHPVTKYLTPSIANLDGFERIVHYYPPSAWQLLKLKDPRSTGNLFSVAALLRAAIR